VTKNLNLCYVNMALFFVYLSSAHTNINYSQFPLVLFSIFLSGKEVLSKSFDSQNLVCKKLILTQYAKMNAKRKDLHAMDLSISRSDYLQESIPAF